jgi:hypothetical protein
MQDTERGTVYFGKEPIGTSATSTAEVLDSYVLPAGALLHGSFKIKACGNFGENTHNKTVSLELLDPDGLAGSGSQLFTATGPWEEGTWNLDAILTAYDEAQRAFFDFHVGVYGVPIYKYADTSAAYRNLSDAMKISVVGQNDGTATVADVQCKMLLVEYLSLV